MKKAIIKYFKSFFEGGSMEYGVREPISTGLFYLAIFLLLTAGPPLLIIFLSNH